jgi:hypothetical protein
MTQIYSNSVKRYVCTASVVVLSMLFILGASTGVKADESDAKKILKAMADYTAAQQSISFAFDAVLEIVTTDEQKLGLASSGTLNMVRPEKIAVTRTGGVADIELTFDGKTLTLLGKNLNLYAQLEVVGNLDHLINELKDTYNQPLPAADLLLSNSYDELMLDVVDVKDLGSGVVGGIVCDHLAFRTEDVDWQIWIAQGEHPYPCRYVITSKHLSSGPQYTVHLRDWKTGGEVAAADFSFKNSTKADKIELKDLKSVDDMPGNYTIGETK